MRFFNLYWLVLIVCFASGCDKIKTYLSINQNDEESEKINSEKESSLNTANIEILTPKERRSVNRLFLTEIYEQIFAKKLKDEEVYRSWMNILEQGASVEGVYRGLVLSNEYRSLEKGITSQEAKNFFSQEIIFLEKWSNQKNTNQDFSQIEANIQKQIESASLFTLKRILGEKILETIEKNKDNKEYLASFYSECVIRWNKHGIDFGFKQRNNNDLSFHESWALKNSRARLQWELLNRMHRLMNFFGQITYN